MDTYRFQCMGLVIPGICGNMTHFRYNSWLDYCINVHPHPFSQSERTFETSKISLCFDIIRILRLEETSNDN